MGEAPTRIQIICTRTNWPGTWQYSTTYLHKCTVRYNTVLWDISSDPGPLAMDTCVCLRHKWKQIARYPPPSLPSKQKEGGFLSRLSPNITRSPSPLSFDLPWDRFLDLQTPPFFPPTLVLNKSTLRPAIGILKTLGEFTYCIHSFFPEFASHALTGTVY